MSIFEFKLANPEVDEEDIRSFAMKALLGLEVCPFFNSIVTDLTLI